MVPEGEPIILSSEKVQQNRNIAKGDKRVSEIQVSAFDEDIEAEGVLDRLQQSLMCIRSVFKG